ncbi:MAG: Smr/MutS family protein [Acidobacteria bacterium]|nr:Smr/MutS family protein [Acidobacteriota bacterium]
MKRARPGDRPDSAGHTDAETFARAMEGVRPIAPDPRGRVRSRPLAPAPVAANPAALAVEEPAGGIDEPFAAPGVDHRLLRRLKRGNIAPTARLDLHGETAADAIVRAVRFVDASRHRHRCICIVHGRGLHSSGKVPILRTQVRKRLRAHHAVLAYTDAPRHDGGIGAVYVLLRK